MMQRKTPVISPEDLQYPMSASDVVIVDARGGTDAIERYSKGHLRGALMVSLETDLSNIGPDASRGGRHPLPDPMHFGISLGKLGITPSSRVFVYDDKAGANAAARFWWMMRSVGHENIQVIDGGLDAIQRAGFPIEQGPPPPSREHPPYPVTTWKLPQADIDAVDSMRSAKDALVIDVREGYRYRGESEPIDLVAGHIPGAINIPYGDNLQADGRFRSADDLAEMYKKSLEGRDPDRITVHCGSGVTACHTLLAMDLAGLPLPRLYVGSWSEWSRNDKPVAAAARDPK